MLRHWVAKFCEMSQTQMLNKFASVPGAFNDGLGQERIVYIPGSRPDRVLMVAHADHVWACLERKDFSYIKVGQHNNCLYSLQQNLQVKYNTRRGVQTEIGIGMAADDRAGCGIVWKLRNLGHSILITSGEEIGCIGSKNLMKYDWWKKELNNHQFMVQFDRRGFNDIVCYDVGTKSFMEYVKKETGYIPKEGSMTDIRVLCRDICGVNMSVGYYNEHTKNEILCLDQFENTLRIAHSWLSQPNLPKFELDKFDLFTIEKPPKFSVTDIVKKGSRKEKYRNSGENFQGSHESKIEKINYSCDVPMDYEVLCSVCKSKFTQEEWLNMLFHCKVCKSLI